MGMDLFRVRINCIDHYQATPTRYDPQLRNDVRPSQAHKGPKVPVVRVFGSTETGQKVCAHIHGAFPYLYVEYQGGLDPEEVGAYIYRLHLSIDHALAVSYRRDQYGEAARFVARITLVKGVPFYGFHVGYRFFLKVYMFNPIVMTRLADLLQQGVIMKHKFQPYEAHLQYLLQFMVDYNLYGCDYLDASRAQFRSPIPNKDDQSSSLHSWHSQSVPDDFITDDPGLPRVSHCSIEVDICVQSIINRGMVRERRLHHDFIERTSPLPADVKLVDSMASLWKDETKRRKRQLGKMKQTSSSFPAEALVSMSADSRDSQAQGWIHEDEYREEIHKLVAEEQTTAGEKPLEFETFAKISDSERIIKTALQSVEDLFPSNLMPVLGLPTDPSQSHDVTSSIEVDEKNVSRAQPDDCDFFPDDSDEDALREVQRLGLDVAQPLKLAAAGTDEAKFGQELPSLLRKTIDKSRPLHELSGVCRSGLVTGHLPKIHLSKSILDAAEDDGLVGRTPKSQLDTEQSVAGTKRGGPSNPQSRRPLKRLKANMTASGKLLNAAASLLTARTNNTPLDQPSTVFTPSEKVRMEIDTDASSRSGQKLGLPLVKEPSISDDKQSQSQSQKSHVFPSLRGAKAKFAKHVSFEPIATQGSPHALSSSLASTGLKTPTEVPKSQASMLSRALAEFSRRPAYLFGMTAPAPADVANMSEIGLPDVVYQDAFYSKEKDVPSRAREYAGREYRLESNTLPFLPAYDPTASSPSLHGYSGVSTADRPNVTSIHRSDKHKCSWQSWEFAKPPPSYHDVQSWWDSRQEEHRGKAKGSRNARSQTRHLSQIDGATPKNKHGFKYSQKPKSTSVEHEVQYMSTMSLEVHVNTRGKFVPNPEEDEIQCIFWALKSDDASLASKDPSDAVVSGIVFLRGRDAGAQQMSRQVSSEVVEEASELDLMVRMVEIVRTHDPDVLTGYEVHGGSWGYLIERARYKYDYNLCDEFSRMRSQSHGRFGKENDRWGFNTTSTIRVTGRHMVNIWRAMRAELNLLQYTMENVAWHLLHRRIPHYAWKTLTSWYKSGKPRDLSKLLRYYESRTRMDIEILEANELIARTSEQARLLGVDFFSVFSRGSQFKVESIMFRIAKPENLILVSPSRKQVGGQNALECLPLVMEPQSAFYSSPLLVLDFQSLYPSVMIAYNLCYSTFLGRITNWRGMNKMGFTEYKRQEGLLALLKDYINIAPNGMMYVKAEIRKSLLAKMLTEILETRVMVKTGMKRDKDDKTLQQLLNNRQLALKLLANVTYGYTSASFSGRMPCAEIADSIVQTGRETLEKAIAFIHSVEKWGAEVVYGDTDSLFVYLKGRSKDQAFVIGNEIAKAITDMNPRPIKLKFEKVYHPCVLLAKKRYVGYKYESPDQVKPEFDAKGIETVRRDGTPAEQKIEEKALKLLFETADLSQIKAYFQKQCEKIMRGAVSVQDFCFAREVRLGTYSDKGAPPAGALISTKKMLEDARAEPQYGERVPYVVITGAPGSRLIDRSVAPEDLLSNPHWQLDAEYYISKTLIPPLERIFNLVGANVRQWYDEMPKVQRIHQTGNISGRKMTLESYLKSTHCIVCSVKFTSQEPEPLCPSCRADAPSSISRLQTRLTTEERKYQEVVTLCQTCSGLSPLEDVRCDSKDCPVFWTRMKQSSKVRGERNYTQPVLRGLVEGMDRLALEW